MLIYTQNTGCACITVLQGDPFYKKKNCIQIFCWNCSSFKIFLRWLLKRYKWGVKKKTEMSQEMNIILIKIKCMPKKIFPTHRDPNNTKTKTKKNASHFCHVISLLEIYTFIFFSHFKRSFRWGKMYKVYLIRSTSNSALNFQKPQTLV